MMEHWEYWELATKVVPQRAIDIACPLDDLDDPEDASRLAALALDTVLDEFGYWSDLEVSDEEQRGIVRIATDYILERDV